MTDKIFLIGNKDDWSIYDANINNIDVLPIKNLPMSYFPFYYNESDKSVGKLERLVPLIENYTRVDGDNKDNAAAYTIDTEKLFNLLTLLEEKDQPFNKNNIKHIKIVIIIIWIIILIGILKMLYYIFKDKYTYFILFMIMLLLIFSTLWALIITNKYF